MRPLRYSVAMSLDGYIAGPNGEYDWIVMDPAIDFAAFFKTIDTVLMGRKTFETALQQGQSGRMPDMRTYVFSRTLSTGDHPDVTIVARDVASTVAELKAQHGRDIWLMGGGEMFRSLLNAKLVDTVEVGIIPILLGNGIPLLPATTSSVRLALTNSETFPTGVVLAKYAVEYG
ncbi:MAG: dihydrofolate reductase family protein [Gemmatimonadales bacterium]